MVVKTNVAYSWFANADSALFTVTFVNAWRSFPFVAVMLYAKMKTVPNEQIDAAKIDGASRFEVMRYIMIPHIKPTMIGILVLSFIWTFNSFGIIYSLTDGGPAGKTETFPLIIQRIAFRDFEFGMAATYSVIMFIMLAVVLILSSNVNKKETD